MRRLVALILTALMLLPATAFGASLFACKMTGRVGSTCCCQRERQAVSEVTRRDAQGREQLKQDDCCERRAISSDQKSGVLDTLLAPPVHAAVLASLVPASEWIERVAGDSIVTPESARGPPPPDTPLYLLNLAILS